MTALLQVKGLAKSFGAVHAVKGLDFAIEEGRCVALLGPNGAGKTTTIRMITGLLKPTEGQLRFSGTGSSGDERRLIGYLPQSPAFYNWMTGFEYAVYAGRLCGLPAKAARERAKELMALVGLSGAAERRIGGYSGGMKQRLGLAQALMHRPKLLVMDEPVSALDPLGRREVLELLRELKRETTMLFSTHVLHDAEELCDDVIIIRDGQIALQGRVAAIRAEHRSPVIELRLERDAASERWLQSCETHFGDAAGEPAGAGLIQAIHVQDGSVRFTVREVDAARQLLLERLAKDRIKLTRLEVGHSSLEDLFMKVVTA
ncbi:ABC transporter ATP-binding protein [Paenibacillus arenilitoris]|uniref:ABC transporter ATP-binding protein n=1 Tax=Paenibacillus arenilitoris TaxID=2772299 RepID=A0A927CRI9_9BACL|nr:ABC transporter ATP-binding protein [Paenibacillus arenilitoris]MBD2870906.1 ABC transporter ATP-binding protein [Paenibacillus arenilitoris]